MLADNNLRSLQGPSEDEREDKGQLLTSAERKHFIKRRVSMAWCKPERLNDVTRIKV